MHAEKPATTSPWLLFHSSMARTKVMPRAGQRKGPQWRHRIQVLFPCQMSYRGEERRQGDWRRWRGHLGHQMVWMVVEAGPLGTVGSESANRIRPTVGGKAPHKEFLKKGHMKKSQKYWPGIVALHKIYQYQKNTELLIHKHPFTRLMDGIALDCI